MSTEANKAVVRRFIADVWNVGKLDIADELIDPGYEVPGVGHGPDAVKRNVTAYRHAFPDLTWTIEDMVAESDRVAVRLLLRGTHRDEFRGIAASGKHVTMQELVIWQIVGERLRRGWFQADMMGLREQLGAIRPH